MTAKGTQHSEPLMRDIQMMVSMERFTAYDMICTKNKINNMWEWSCKLSK